MVDPSCQGASVIRFSSRRYCRTPAFRSLSTLSRRRVCNATSVSTHVRPWLAAQPDKLKLIGDYKAKIEKELETICGDILTIIDDNLLPNSQSNEPKVFYYKMQGEERDDPSRRRRRQRRRR